jgi:hypothetical protein
MARDNKFCQLQALVLFVLSLHVIVANALGQRRDAISRRHSERHAAEQGDKILLFVPGLARVADANRFATRAISRIVADGLHVDCVVFSHEPHVKENLLYSLLHDVCDVRENIRGTYYDHFVAAAQLESFRSYSYVMVWGPRLWVPIGGWADDHELHSGPLNLHRLVGILKANDLQAIAPAMKLECEHPGSRSVLPPDTTFPDGPNPLARDLPHMFPTPLNGSNTSVGRRVDFIEWQAALLPVKSFECIVSIIRRCKLKYWGADVVFPTVCKARVGVVDLPDLSVSKCRQGGKQDYSDWLGFHDMQNALEEARRVDISFHQPTGKTRGQLVRPE